MLTGRNHRLAGVEYTGWGGGYDGDDYFAPRFFGAGIGAGRFEGDGASKYVIEDDSDSWHQTGVLV